MPPARLPFLNSLYAPDPAPDPEAIPLPASPGTEIFTQPQPQQNPLEAIQIASPQPNLAPPPKETKAHKLIRLLQAGLVGGLAGQEAEAKTYAQTGRSGGVGVGFTPGAQAVAELPFLKQFKQAALEREQAQTEAIKANSAMIDTPSGPMPMGLAKIFYPAQLRYQGQVKSAEIGAKGRVEAAQATKKFLPVPGVGLFDTQTRQVLPGTAQGITVTPEIAQQFDLPQDFIGKPMTLSNLAAVERAQVFQESPQMTAQGPIVVNRKNATARPVQGPGGQTYSPPALASPREVADVNNPGQTKTVSGGQAIAEHAPGVQSASVQVPKKAAIAEVPTNIGNQKVAFKTAIQHADLLRQAVKALGNGDQQTLSGLKNRFKNEFGIRGPITAQAIADAYQREVTSVLSKGHMTNSEIATVGKTINPNKQNYGQIDSVLNAYQALAQSKMNVLDEQKNTAISQSQPGAKGEEAGKEIHYKIVNGKLVPE